jgi:hypothetical protein
MLRGYWQDIVLNVHAPTEDKSDDMMNSLYKELECVFDQFPKYHMKVVRRFQCKSTEWKYFQINIWEWEFTWS